MGTENFFFRITELKNEIDLNEKTGVALIRQTVTVESERAATLFVSQLIDGLEMIEAVRHPVEKGKNILELKDLKVVNPRYEEEDGSPAYYDFSVGVMAAGVGVREAREFVRFERKMKR